MASRSRKSAAIGLLDQALLLGDVDGDADQVQAGFAVLARQFAARPQPQPAAVGVAHAKGVIERLHLGVGELRRQLVEIDVVGMHQRVDLAEGQQIVLLRQAENVEHRMRPEHAAAREVPVPQPAAAAIERGVDAAAHGVVDEVGLARARRLPMEGEAEDEHHEAGGGRQRDGQRGGRSPVRERVVAAWTTASMPSGFFSARTVAKAASPSGSVISMRAGGGAERGQRLRRSEHVEDVAALDRRLARACRR